MKSSKPNKYPRGKKFIHFIGNAIDCWCDECPNPRNETTGEWRKKKNKIEYIRFTRSIATFFHLFTSGFRASPHKYRSLHKYMYLYCDFGTRHTRSFHRFSILLLCVLFSLCQISVRLFCWQRRTQTVQRSERKRCAIVRRHTRCQTIDAFYCVRVCCALYRKESTEYWMDILSRFKCYYCTYVALHWRKCCTRSTAPQL